MNKAKKVNTAYTYMFSGVIGKEYEMLKLICPLATEMSRLVGDAVKQYAADQSNSLSVVELGGGTGITTLSILLADQNLSVLSVDNAPTMQSQAQASLKDWVEQQRLSFCSNDALTVLESLESESVDLIASAYTVHNFEQGYRKQVYQQIYRVLKKGGQFINGDRYALDDISEHTHTVQQEIAGYFKVLKEINKLDVLEHWIIHLFNDESENHLMRESVALKHLNAAGFTEIQLTDRMQVNALVTAKKA